MATAVQGPLSLSTSTDAAAIRTIVEAASLAMVREFLAKRRYKKTLDMLSTELPEPPQPTTSSAVAKQLGILKLHQSNTKSQQPYPTLLEALANSLIVNMSTNSADNTMGASPSHTTPAPPITSQTAAKPGVTTVRTAAFAASPTGAVASPASVSAAPQAKVAFSVAPSTALKPAATAPVSSTSLTSNAFTPASLALMSRLKHTTPPAATTKPPPRQQIQQEEKEEQKQQHPSSSILRTAPRVQRVDDNSELLMEEFDDNTNTTAPSRITAARTPSTATAATASSRTILTPAAASSTAALFPSPSSAPPVAITQAEAQQLRTVTFGNTPTNPSASFSQSWKQQGFYYTSHTALPYGLVQRDGGPCGLIAAVQAEVIRELLWSEWRTVRSIVEVSEADQQRAMVHALATMLWRAGGGKQAKIATTGSKNSSSSSSSGNVKNYKADGITECLLIHTATSYQSLCSLLYHNLAQFLHPHSHGLILILYSLCLSRTLTSVISDFDYEGCVLIGQHAYCTQELVNLCMTGQAVSNVFDGNKSMDGMVMKGIAVANSSSGVGFVSLFEHYGYVEVGNVLKFPKFPVWIVCSESHYSVLFCEDKLQASAGAKSSNGGGKFDLFYYDELIKQQEVVRLTVDCSGKSDAPRSKDLEPPLNDCIRTRWGKHARVSWNGTEPIL